MANFEFKKLEVSDADFIRNQLGNPTREICDHSVGNMFMWRKGLDTEFEKSGGKLLLREHHKGKRYYALRLCDGDFIRRVRELLEYENGELNICSITDAELSLLRENFPDISVEADRGYADYVYDAADMISFSGRHYHSHKNHLNAFLRECDGATFLPLKADELSLLSDFLCEYKEAADKTSATAINEVEAAERLLPDIVNLGLLCNILRHGDKIIGFSVGEIVGDTLMMHIEKALPNYRGAYPMLTNSFAKEYAKNLKYTNREEDDGDEGLRLSKLSYHPLCIVQKYVVNIKSLL